jgi:hypothetical protein
MRYSKSEIERMNGTAIGYAIRYNQEVAKLVDVSRLTTIGWVHVILEEASRFLFIYCDFDLIECFFFANVIRDAELRYLAPLCDFDKIGQESIMWLLEEEARYALYANWESFFNPTSMNLLTSEQPHFREVFRISS